jgi:transcriptional regulator with XRE-family HTH domain
MVVYDFSAYQRRMSVHSDVDRLVGGALRAERRCQELSETSFAVLAAVSVDQLRRHESGVDRISAARLFEFAEALRVPVKRFFEPFG